MLVTRLLLLYALLSYTILAQAQETRKFDYFDAVSVSGDVNVRLVKSDSPSAEITTEGMDEDDVTIYIKNETLRIQLIEGWFDDAEEVDITVYYEQLRYIKATAGARVEADEVLQGEQFKLRAASGALLAAEVDVQSLEVSVSEGAELTVKGQAEKQEANVSTGGQYHGLDLNCQETTVTVHTGGEAFVVANERLDANAHTGGSIHYKGDPAYKSTRSLISGGIRSIRTEEQ